jgi:hypothetical protein
MLDFCVSYTMLPRVQSIFASFYAVFSTGALEKSTSMRVRPIPAKPECHNRGFTTVHEVLRLSCSICSIRKEKRFCLALHGRICAQCCGEQRENTLECPSDCPYLQQARQHDKPRDFGDLPPREVFPEIEVREDFLLQHEPLMAGILQTLGRLARADRSINDRQFIGALANMASSYQTLVASGLVYREGLPNPAQQTIIDTLQGLFEEFRQVEQKHRGYTTLKDRDVLNALVFTLRMIHLHTSGRPLSRGFIDFLHERFPEPETALGASADTGSRIIMP